MQNRQIAANTANVALSRERITLRCDAMSDDIQTQSPLGALLGNPEWLQSGKLLSISDAREILSCGRTHLETLIADKHLAAVDISHDDSKYRTLRVLPTELARFMESRLINSTHFLKDDAQQQDERPGTFDYYR